MKKKQCLLWAGAAFWLLSAGYVAWAEEAAKERPLESLDVAPPRPQPIVSEKLSFHGRWFGIPVGTGWIEVKAIIDVGGRQAYHIEAQGQTNDVLSKFYPIHDVLHTYVDVETLRPLKFEKRQREGRYRSDEVVIFDHGKREARYRSLLNESEKTIPLPEDYQDLISAIYWFRRQPLEPGQPLQANLYTDEKVFETVLEVQKPRLVEVLKRGTFPCLVVEPKAQFKGLLVKRGRIWAYFTADERRIPILVKATTPWGSMSAVIDVESLAPTDMQGKP